MLKRKLGRCGVLLLSLVVLLTVGSGSGRTQYVVVPGSQSKNEPPRIPPSDIKVPTPPTPMPPPPPTVEDLIKQLEQLRKQKAELEAHEKVVISRLQERMKDQTDRLNKLGIILPAPPPVVQDTADTITPLLKYKGGRDEEKPK